MIKSSGNSLDRLASWTRNMHNVQPHYYIRKGLFCFPNIIFFPLAMLNTFYLLSRHRFYEFGDKPSKALALQLKLQGALLLKSKTQQGILYQTLNKLIINLNCFILLCISQTPSKILILLITFLKILTSLKSVTSQKPN